MYNNIKHTKQLTVASYMVTYICLYIAQALPSQWHGWVEHGIGWRWRAIILVYMYTHIN